MDTYATIGDCASGAVGAASGPSDRVGRRPCRLRCAPYDDRLPHAVGWRRHHELRGSLGGRGGEAGYRRGRLRRLGDRTGHRWGGLRRGRDARRRRCRRCCGDDPLCAAPARAAATGGAGAPDAPGAAAAEAAAGAVTGDGAATAPGGAAAADGTGGVVATGGGGAGACGRGAVARAGSSPSGSTYPSCCDARARPGGRSGPVLGLTARAHRGRPASPSSTASPFATSTVPEVEERHRVPVGREDRDARARSRDEPAKVTVPVAGARIDDPGAPATSTPRCCPAAYASRPSANGRRTVTVGGP